MTEKEILKLVAKSPGWLFWGRNFSILTRCTITVPIDGNYADIKGEYVGATAAEIFRHMRLDLDELSQIFVEKPWEYYLLPKESRPRQLKAKSYNKLGKCRVWDEEGWSRLALMTNKNILFYHGHGDHCGFGEPELRAIYYHNGSYSVVNPDTDWEFDGVNFQMIGGIPILLSPTPNIDSLPTTHLIQ